MQIKKFDLPDGAETEPMLAVDCSGSMGETASPTDSIKRFEVVTEAFATIVERLEEMDSQAAEEEAEHAAGQDADEEDLGGVWTVAFNLQAHVLGDVNSDNLREKMGEIPWGGGTKIVPAFNSLLSKYKKEFIDEAEIDPATGLKKVPPYLLMLMVTDGEPADEGEFEEVLARTGGKIYVVMAVIGHGHQHDAAIRAYTRISQSNDHIRVIPLNGTTDPNELADALLGMVE